MCARVRFLPTFVAVCVQQKLWLLHIFQRQLQVGLPCGVCLWTRVCACAGVIASSPCCVHKHRLCVCVSVCVCVCIYVCLCVFERERERVAYTSCKLDRYSVATE